MGGISGLLDRARRFPRDRGGLAALEFALLVPLLFALYFLTMEVAQAIEANRKVNRIGGMVGDLVTQQMNIPMAELEGIMRIGEATMQPYNRSQPNIVVTAIEITDEPTPEARVVWSRQLAGGSFGAGPEPGTLTTVPPALRIRGSFLIRAESSLAYEPVITWVASAKDALGLASAFDGIAMAETFHLRPRMSRTISCPDC